MTNSLVPSAKRSRRGCTQCKLKRVKCDELKPSCSTCVARKIKCQYYLKLQFREDYEGQGKKFGREGVWLKTKKLAVLYDKMVQDVVQIPVPELLVFVNFCQDQAEDRNMMPLRISGEIPGSKAKELSLDLHDLVSALNYYVTRVAPMFEPVSCNGVLDLSMKLLLEYSIKYPHLHYLIAALGAGYLSRTDSLWTSKCLHFKRRGIADLNTATDNNTSETSVFIAMFLLLLIEISLGTDDWLVYLKLAKNIILSSSFETPLDPIEVALFNFTLEFFHYTESLGRTVCRDKNGFSLFLENFNSDQKVVSWMGCNRKLLTVISDITDLCLERESLQKQQYKLLCDDMRTKLEKWQVPLFDATIEQKCFTTVCKLKHLSTVIYYECSLNNMTPESVTIQDKVALVFVSLRELEQFDYPWFSTLTWCLFIAGVQISIQDSRCEEYRFLTIKFLSKLEALAWGDIRRIRDVIVRVWRMRDLGEGEGNNDWERYVADTRYNITLA